MAANGVELPASLKAGAEVGPNPPRVMIVEDDDDIRRALTEMLEERGFEVRGAANGRQALDTLRTEALPFIILLDLMMPVMDGWDFRREQLGDPVLREIPVVVLTATGFSHDTVRTQLGDVALLPKPICLPELFRLLDRGNHAADAAA